MNPGLCGVLWLNGSPSVLKVLFQGMNGPNELFYQKAKRLLHKKYSSLRLGSIINVGVRKYSFLTPFLHKKVDIDGIHSYN
ncbi:MAG: hypothetical protein ACLUAA_10105 [Acidaminococcus intestini]